LFSFSVVVPAGAGVKCRLEAGGFGAAGGGFRVQGGDVLAHRGGVVRWKGVERGLVGGSAGALAGDGGAQRRAAGRGVDHGSAFLTVA
jgi:hypothetical protein